MEFEVRFNHQSSQLAKVPADKHMGGKNWASNLLSRLELLWPGTFVKGMGWKDNDEICR